MSEPLLKVEGLGVSYGAVSAVRDLSFTVDPGEFVAIVGTNGAGKSSTLKAIMGLVRPSAGRVVFGPDQRVISGSSAHAIVRLGVAMVPEGRRMLGDMTVEENLLIGALAARNRSAREVDEIYEMFPRLRERRQALAGNLSGGEQQMVAIGRALISSPTLLLMDEPSLGLAPSVAADVYRMISEVNAGGMAVLLVDQNVRLSLEVASRFYVMRNGEVVGSGEASTSDAQLARLPELMGLSEGAPSV